VLQRQIRPAVIVGVADGESRLWLDARSGQQLAGGAGLPE
jgi:hypothetical protein